MNDLVSPQLAASLLHSLWQGGVIAALLYASLRLLSGRRPQQRYGLSLAAILLLVASWLVTWAYLEHSSRPAAAASEPAAAFHSAERVSINEPAPAMAPSATPSHSLHPNLSSAPTAPAAFTAGQPDPSWRTTAHTLCLVWLAGSLFFQLRILLALGRTRMLDHHSTPIDNPELHTLFNRLAAQWNLRRRARLSQSDSITGPCVYGLLKPVVLLPGSLLTRMPQEYLEAVIAHELAHIRRYDYLINLLQMALEGLLFFNPFIWWISRQVRIEREACCDAMAGTVTGRVVYARALADYAEWTQPKAQAAPSAAIGIDSGHSLFERIRRLLHPGSRPALRLSPVSLLAVVAACFIGLAGLKATAVKAFAMMTPAERVAKLAELESEYPNDAHQRRAGSSREELKTITVSGKISTADGEPLPSRTFLNVHSQSSGRGTSATAGVDKESGMFSDEIHEGTIGLMAGAPGYANAFAGPFKGTNNLADIDLVLDKGYAASLRFEDHAGNPISDVHVTGGYAMTFGTVHTINETSDAEGLVSFPHATARELMLSAKHPRFEHAETKQLLLKPNQVSVWQLSQGQATSGIVLFEETSEPAAGARIYLAQSHGPGPHHGYGDPSETTLLSKTSEDGSFSIRSLRDDTLYHLFVVAEGASPAVVGPVHGGEQDLQFTLPRAQFVTITAQNVSPADLDRKGRLTVNYRYTLQFGTHSHSKADTFHQIPENQTAQFKVGPLWKGAASFVVGEETPDALPARLQLDWSEVKVLTNPIVVDLATAKRPKQATKTVQLAPREIRLIFETPKDHPAVKGTALIEYTRKGTEEGTRSLTTTETLLADVQENQATVQVPAPTTISIKPHGIIGYWFPTQTRLQIDEGSEPLFVELKAVPAGALHGTIRQGSHNPLGRLSIDVLEEMKSPHTQETPLSVDVKSSRSADHLEWRFHAAALPLDGTYRICAHQGATYVVSSPLSLDAANPIQELTLAIPDGQRISGQILEPDGSPWSRREIELLYRPVPSRGFGSETWTDAQGWFLFDRVNPDVPGSYFIEIQPAHSFQPVRREVHPGTPAEIRLLPGQVIKGNAVDSETGWPIPGAEIYALPVRDYSAPSQNHWPGWYDADALADEKGRFIVSTLPAGRYTLHSRSGRLQNPQTEVEAGAPQPVTLELELYEWTSLAPVKPAQ